MKKVIFITVCALVLFMAEYVCYHLFGRMFCPNLLLLLVIFVDLFLGIRYGIATAVLAGIIHDAVSVSFFGIYIFSYLMCSYMAVILKKYVYMAGSKSSRLLLVAIISLVYFLIQFFLRLMFQPMFQPMSFGEAFSHVFLPQFITTLIVATIIFEYLKKCALKFYVS